jgi:hypothetical protein
MKAPAPLPTVPRKRSHAQILPVIPAQAGIQYFCDLSRFLDSGLRRNDGLGEICVYGIQAEAA